MAKGDSQSHIDMTMVSSGIVKRITNKRILEEESYSDHFNIEYKIEETKTPIPLKEYTRRNLRNIDPKKVEKVIDKNITVMCIDHSQVF